MSTILPISAIIATRNRAEVLRRMLNSLAGQSAQPVEAIVVDASVNDETDRLCQSPIRGLDARITYHRAQAAGAIEQRNQAMSHATQDAVLFLDDDILLEPECVARLWEALQSNETIGGVNALITNQLYASPGIVSRTIFHILSGRREKSYAGKCIGPACNLLPEDRADLPPVVEVEWLNTTCTLYKKRALPDPPFQTERFRGRITLPVFPIEDLALSIRVGKRWRLANARTSRIFHDSQQGVHKSNLVAMSEIELLNRYYVMTRLLERSSFLDHLKLLLWEVFGIISCLATWSGWKRLPAVLAGKLAGAWRLLVARN